MGIDGRVCVLVSTCQAYEDIAVPFDIFYREYFSDVARLVYVSDKISPHIAPYLTGAILEVETDSWKERLISAVEQVDADYFILMLEDYFISQTVERRLLDIALEGMIVQEIQYLRLHHRPRPLLAWRGNFSAINSQPYGINLQPAIWRKDFLLHCLKESIGPTAWDFEIHLSQALLSGGLSLEGCMVFRYEPFKIKNAILKGRWDPAVLTWTKQKLGADFVTERRSLSFGSLLWIKARGVGARLVPNAMRVPIKRYMNKLGFQFTTNF